MPAAAGRVRYRRSGSDGGTGAVCGKGGKAGHRRG